MKNFPHQISKIPRLVAALGVFNRLSEVEGDVADDGVYGYALAQAGVYIFRHRSGFSSLEERIEAEKEKDLSDQGARTCARELRRFFIMLGAIELTANKYRVTNIGTLILTAGDRMDVKVIDIWRDCLRNIIVEDESGISHPYYILLKLVNDFPGIERKRLALALEASNDSDEEYLRIYNLANREAWDGAINASKYQQANAVKILPALAIQTLDISETNGMLYPLNPVPPTTQYDTRIRFAVLRSVNAQKIAAIPTLQDDETEAEPTIVNFTSTISLIRDRTIRHQQLVKKIAQILERSGYELSENPMDCLATKQSLDTILIEAKTIGDNKTDEGKQVRLSLGQLTYYENFYVDSQDPIIKIAFFDAKISNAHIDYLQKYDCYTLWYFDNSISGSIKAIEFFTTLGVDLFCP